MSIRSVYPCTHPPTHPVTHPHPHPHAHTHTHTERDAGSPVIEMYQMVMKEARRGHVEWRSNTQRRSVHTAHCTLHSPVYSGYVTTSDAIPPTAPAIPSARAGSSDASSTASLGSTLMLLSIRDH